MHLLGHARLDPEPWTVRPTTAATPCLEVRTADDRCLIFDAGTGIRELGKRLPRPAPLPGPSSSFPISTGTTSRGCPFFAPLYDANTRLRIHGARQDGVDIKSILKGLMTPTYFPVPYEALSATIEFAHLDAGPWERPGVRVSAFRVRHQGHTYGFRIDADDVSLAYVPDDELVGGSYDVDDGWYDRLVEFLDGVDLLFHDAMFTDAEYPRRVGWGHSTFRQAVELAEAAGVRRLAFFHHAPRAHRRRARPHPERTPGRHRPSRILARARRRREGEEIVIRRGTVRLHDGAAARRIAAAGQKTGRPRAVVFHPDSYSIDAIRGALAEAVECRRFGGIAPDTLAAAPEAPCALLLPYERTAPDTLRHTLDGARLVAIVALDEGSRAPRRRRRAPAPGPPRPPVRSAPSGSSRRAPARRRPTQRGPRGAEAQPHAQ